MSDDDLSTVLQASPDERGARQVRYRLVISEGVDRGETFEVEPAQRVLIGQSPACDVRLKDRLASRRHAAIESTAQGLRVSDVGSTNGTFVQGVRVVDALLEGGETIRIGETTIVVDRATETVPRRGDGAPMRFGKVAFGSPEMRRIHPLFERLAKATVPVVIEGETGTGKELLAESLHDASPRSAGPFVVFDCTAVPPTLM